MKFLTGLLVIFLIGSIIYVSEWQFDLSALIALALIVLFTGRKDSDKSKKTSNQDNNPYVYEVTDIEGKNYTVKSHCSPQFDGDWVHFTDEIPADGKYVSRETFYKPDHIKIVRSDGNNVTLN